MFKRQQIEAYKGITAPPELKKRILRSVEKRRKRFLQQSAAWAMAAACLTVAIWGAGFWQNGSAVVFVNGLEVTRQAIDLAVDSDQEVAMASMARSVEPQIQIPLEIKVKTQKHTHISVSEGRLQTAKATMSEEAFAELEITEGGLVYWTLPADANTPAVCEIKTGGKKYTYTVEFQEKTASFIIRKE